MFTDNFINQIFLFQKNSLFSSELFLCFFLLYIICIDKFNDNVLISMFTNYLLFTIIVNFFVIIMLILLFLKECVIFFINNRYIKYILKINIFEYV